jgi:hypothetical protein
MPVRSREQLCREERGGIAIDTGDMQKKGVCDVREVSRPSLRRQNDERPEKIGTFLSGLEGEIIAIILNVTMDFFWIHLVEFLLIKE